MNKTTVDRRETSFFSTTANELVYSQEQLKAFINTPFSSENLFKQKAVEKVIEYKLDLEHFVNAIDAIKEELGKNS